MNNPVSSRISSTLSATPGRAAFEVEGVWKTWSDVASIARALQARLEAVGIPAGSVLGLVGRNRMACASAFLGLLERGDCIIPVSPFQASGAVFDDLNEIAMAGLVAEQSDVDELGLVDICARQAIPLLTLRADGSVVASSEVAAPRVVGNTGTVAFLIGTSGTSGRPKRIPIRYDTLGASINETAQINKEFGEEALQPWEQPPLIQYSPLVHITGSLSISRAGIEGRRLVLLEKFSAIEWIRAVRTYHHRIAGLPPAMMKMVLDERPSGEDLSSLTAVWSGSAPVDLRVADEFARLYDVRILGNYGATEYCGVIANNHYSDQDEFGDAKKKAVGRIRRNVADFRIVDTETGRETVGQGLLEVRVHRVGPEWVRTSDIASIDDDDFLYIHGRSDDAINRGGFKIVPEIVSDALKLNKSVRDAVVIGIPDRRLGQVPVAVVELYPGEAEETPESLMRFAREHLVAYQAPKYIKIVDCLPRTASMKFDRRQLKALFEDSPQMSKMKDTP